MPRFVSAAAFATLLHNKDAGHGAPALAAADECTIRRCAGNTLVLGTDGSTADDAVRGIDFGAFGQ